MAKKENSSLLEEFLDNIESVPVDLVNALLKSTSDEDEKNIINALGPTLIDQFKEINRTLSESVKKVPRQSLNEVETYLRISSGVSLVKNFKIILPSVGSPTGKIGIAKIIEQIKKLIDFIVDKLLGKLLGKFLDWLKPIIELIDEIINAILSLGSLKMSNILSKLEQNYLAELTQLAKLQNAANNFVENDDEED
ncbi:MAG: hypothetical protein OEL77_02850 [Nitrosopumilus sp.]|nr:hypothetical protein [Nitrosopumilus sp.]MDH3384933.1 hypothetical protein [Nitrosopumilus sp.]